MAEDLKHPFNHGLLEELIVFGLMLPDLGDGLTLNLASIVKVESQVNTSGECFLLITSLGGIYTELSPAQTKTLTEKIRQLLTLAASTAPKSPNSRIVLPHRRQN